MIPLLAIIAISVSIPFAFAEGDNPPTDIPIKLDAAQGIIIVVGIAGGVVYPLLGWNHAAKGESFSTRKFITSVVTGAIVSVGLAMGASDGMREITYFNVAIIFMAAIGGSAIPKFVKIK